MCYSHHMTTTQTLSVRLRATYQDTEWVTNEFGFAEPDTDPIITGGYTDVANPFGGFRTPLDGPDDGPTVPADADQATRTALWDAWYAENVDTVEVYPWEAAQMVLDFPGGVWNYSESFPEQDYRTGVYTSVTLHVVDHEETVFALADMISGTVVA